MRLRRRAVNLTANLVTGPAAFLLAGMIDVVAALIDTHVRRPSVKGKRLAVAKP